MFRCAQSTEKPKIKTINQSKPEAGKPGAKTLGPYTPSSVIPKSPCHVLELGFQEVASSWPGLFGH